MDHLDIVSGAARSDPLATGDVIVGANFSGDRLEDGLHDFPRRRRTARHQAGAFQRALFATRDTAAAVEETHGFDFGRASFGVGVVRVAAVDDHIAGFQQRLQLCDQGVDGGAGLDQHHDFAWSLESPHQILQRVAADHPASGGFAGQELVGHRRRAVVDRHGVAAAFDVQRQVLAHDSQTNHGEVTRCSTHPVHTFESRAGLEVEVVRYWQWPAETWPRQIRDRPRARAESRAGRPQIHSTGLVGSRRRSGR